MKNLMKNIPYCTALSLADQVDYLEGQIVSKTLVQNEHHNMTLFAFEKGEEISAHDSAGDAMVIVLDGTAEITIDDIPYTVKAGETIIMPARVLHAVYALERFKMLLTVLFEDTK